MSSRKKITNKAATPATDTTAAVVSAQEKVEAIAEATEAAEADKRALPKVRIYNPTTKKTETVNVLKARELVTAPAPEWHYAPTEGD